MSWRGALPVLFDRAPRPALLALVFAAFALLLPPSRSVPPVHADSHCTFVLGLASLRASIGPAIVGDCLEDEHFDPAYGTAEQHTSGGLLVWHKANNWTAFTDGHHTWGSGPDGVQVRLNTERFAWERDPPSPPTIIAVVPSGAASRAASP